MSMDVSVNVPQLGKMAQATRRDERLMEKIAANATSADTVVNPEVGRLRVEVESLKAELEHWRTCAERWHTTARAMRERLDGKQRRSESSTLRLEDI